MAPSSLSIDHSPYVPYDPDVHLYDGMLRPFLVPYEYTGWRNEQLSWKETAYLHGNLNPSPWLRISGPQAREFLESVSVNSFAKFDIGAGKHQILCNDDGLVMAHGVLLRTGENEYESQWMAPYLAYLAETTDFDVTAETISRERFLFQIAGPRSFEILRAATGEDISDIRFMRFRSSRIGGSEVRALRMGMGGALSYEIHGAFEDALPVYDAILAAGEPYGLRRLGTWAYMMNHTENGFPQSFYHFPLAWATDPGFVDWMAGHDMGTRHVLNTAMLRGSVGDDLPARYRNPIELGWGSTVRFDHEFPGRAALELEVASPTRKMVTLRWNVDDIMDVARSQFEPGEHYMPMDAPIHSTRQYGGQVMYADKVLDDDDRVVGISSGRAYSYYFREMISLCSLDVRFADGDEVRVLWGDPGTRQKEIRATVTRFPYLDLPRNQDVDVSLIGA